MLYSHTFGSQKASHDYLVYKAHCPDHNVGTGQDKSSVQHGTGVYLQYNSPGILMFCFIDIHDANQVEYNNVWLCIKVLFLWNQTYLMKNNCKLI